MDTLHCTDHGSVADIIRSCLGPKAMLKMLLDPMGGIVLTNDGHAILREIDVAHPAAKSMIELSRTQDEEVGDGTTTVIILGGCCWCAFFVLCVFYVMAVSIRYTSLVVHDRRTCRSRSITI